MPRAKSTRSRPEGGGAGGPPQAGGDPSGLILLAILERTDQGIAIAGPDGTVRKVNRRGADLSGRPASEIEGRPAGEIARRWSLRRPDGTVVTAAEVPLERAVRDGKEIAREEWILERPEGIRIPILWSAAPILGPGGQLLGGVMLWSPLAEPPAAAAPEEAPEEAARSAEPGKIRILLVEDHADTAAVLSQLLRGRGYSVRTAASLVEARALTRKERFDLVVSDLALPDGSGHDLMRELASARPVLRGIALSGYGMAEDLEASRAAGFAEHLTKPVEFVTLLAAIERIQGVPGANG